MGYTIIGGSPSPFVRKVMVLMQEKGLEYEHEEINPFAPPPDFRDVSPLGKIPAFRHDDRIINDSSVICRYLEHLHPEPSLYPGDPYAYARATWIEEYADGGFVPIAGGKIFLPLVVRPMMTGKEPDESGPRKAFAEDLPPFFDYFEAQLGSADYFVDGALSIADLTVGSVMANLRLAGFVPDAGRWPGLYAFIKHMHERPSFDAVIAPLMPAFGKRWVEIQ